MRDGQFGQVRDAGIVLNYDFERFFEFCQYLCLFGYRVGGFVGKLQTPKEFVEHQIGNCWDQTELQRAWFEQHNYHPRTYLLYYELSENCWPSHSILAYQEGGKWYWFEPMFCGGEVEYSGVHEYASEAGLLTDLKRVFTLIQQKNGFLPKELEQKKWSVYEYLQPKYGINDMEFYRHCRRGRKVLV